MLTLQLLKGHHVAHDRPQIALAEKIKIPRNEKYAGT